MIRDIISKDNELLAIIKSIKYGFIIMNFYALYNSLYYLFTLGLSL